LFPFCINSPRTIRAANNIFAQDFLLDIFEQLPTGSEDNDIRIGAPVISENNSGRCQAFNALRASHDFNLTGCDIVARALVDVEAAPSHHPSREETLSVLALGDEKLGLVERADELAVVLEHKSRDSGHHA
jgi:hypothetical protein